MVICYGSKRKLICTILREIKCKVSCITEQFLTLYWGKGKDGGAMKELGVRGEVCIFFFNSFGSRVLDLERLTLALKNLLNSVISVLLICNNYTIDLMHVLVGKIIFNLCP